MVTDWSRGLVVLVGGGGANGTLGDTWLWSGQWQRAAIAPVQARDFHGLAFDTRRSIVVLFGGFDDLFQVRGDTWEFDGFGWVRRVLVGPPPRAGHAMCFDEMRGVTVVFGGTTTRPLGDTWEWDGTTWTQRALSGPPPGQGEMVYDAGLGMCLLSTYETGFYNSTWTWDGVEWREVPVRGPTRRWGFSMSFDPRRERIVVFGGGFDNERFNDTWEYGLYPDCDQTTGAGELDIFDVLCFLNKFVANEPYACDCDTATGQGVCDVFDFMCFQDLFANCP